MKRTINPYIIIFGFALLKFLVPFFLIHSSFELHRDEYLYLADSDHLAWGYVEMPPLLAVLGYISKLMGGSIAAVYFWSSFFGALTIWVIGKIVLALRGNSFAVFMACLAFLCSGFLRMNILFQPNFLDVFFWTISSYQIIQWINTKEPKYLYFLGICFGFGMLAKYTIAFYIIAFLFAVLLSDKRKWLLNVKFYLAMLLGLAICSPNLFWQYQHHFPVMYHMDLLTNQQLRSNNRLDFLVGQLIFSLPSLFIWLGGFWYLLMEKEGRKHILIAFIYIGIISLLLYFNGKGYYAASIYPTLMAFGGIWFSKIIEKKYISWLKWAAPILIVSINFFILPMALPVFSPTKLESYYKAIHIEKSSILTWEDHQYHPLPQDFADMLGWKEMAFKTAKVYKNLPDSVQQQTMVYGDNYGEAGAVSFYRKKLGLPEIFSDNASFNFWLPEKFTQKYFLFITHHLPDEDDAFFNHWQKREIMDSVTQKYAREFGAKIILYSQPDDSVKIIAETHLLHDKKKFKLD